MSDAEFGSTQPGYFRLLMEAWRNKQRRQDLRAGQICTMLAEVNRDRNKRARPYTPADFFPSLADLVGDFPDEEALEEKLDRVFGL